MYYLTISERKFLNTQGNARSVRTVEIPAYRGMITDRNGIPLAVSTPVEAVWVNPKEFNANHHNVAKLFKYLNLNQVVVSKKLAKIKNKEFVYLKRGLEPILGAKIKQLNVPGIHLQAEFRRYYPEGEVGAHLIGFTNVDDQGQEGLELAYNDWLKGVPGKKRVVQDRLGNIIAELAHLSDPRPGNNLVLSIDRRIQYIAYRELKEAVKTFKARSGSAIVLDAHSGEVLAIVNQPSYNPNVRPNTWDPGLRNRAITDVFEPGSVIKAFSIASALNSKLFTPNTKIDTSPGWLYLGKHAIYDDHHENNGIISVTEVLKRSSNIGVTKMTLALPPEDLWKMLHKVGFGQRTESNFPGESPGSLDNRPVWRPFVLATLAFGYGLSVTPLQLAQAYAIFANDGKMAPISLLKIDKPPVGEQILSSNIAHQMLNMLMAVVEEEGGTGIAAQIPGYQVAGKTGTARIAGVKGYDSEHHIGTFIGIAPVSLPRLVVVVMINDPLEKYYAAQVAAPTFARITAASLQVLDIPPDNVKTAMGPNKS